MLHFRLSLLNELAKRMGGEYNAAWIDATIVDSEPRHLEKLGFTKDQAKILLHNPPEIEGIDYCRITVRPEEDLTLPRMCNLLKEGEKYLVVRRGQGFAYGDDEMEFIEETDEVIKFKRKSIVFSFETLGSKCVEVNQYEKWFRHFHDITNDEYKRLLYAIREKSGYEIFILSK